MVESMRTIKQHLWGIDEYPIIYRIALFMGYFLGNNHIGRLSLFSAFFGKSHTRGTQIMRIITNVAST